MNPLHVPLANLPAPVPEGTPGILDGNVRVVIMYQHNDDSYAIGHPSMDYRPPCSGARLAVDLSPPPIDANGHPTRIDAMPILVSMLARAMGHPEGQYTFMPSTTPGAWNLRTFIDGPVRRMSSTFRPDGVGALASIEPRATNAPRLALAALFAARVWETA